ncbi:C1 family peptidase [Longitalea luteola]|uniref:C1 family peptidase n=1 Tax=Longitalea luteola TaxID=2812563 RepID=UPI001A97ADCC|nr:C1 family peptidase [Longitalea luteola]
MKALICKRLVFISAIIALLSCQFEAFSQFAQMDIAKENNKFYEKRESIAPASVQIKLKALRDVIAENSLTFTVGYTSVSNRDIATITGERELSKEENERYKSELKRKELSRPEKSKAYIKVGGITLSPNARKLDLRKYDLVTPIKDQNPAGSCWAFGSMAAYESNYDVINSLDINTSEQDVINCSGAGSASRGGLAFEVFNWMVSRSRNVDDEANTPYQAIDAPCNRDLPATNYFAIDWDFVDPGKDPGAIPTVKQIKEALCKYGVISASVYVSESFQYYTGGIFKEKERYSGTNHAIAIIGWDDDKNAWLLKNSWGVDWGESCGFGPEKGYMWIHYETNNIGRRAAWIESKKVL